MDFTFLSREGTVAEIEAAVEAGSVLLEGARGVGKTRLLEHLETRSRPDRLVLRFDLQGASSAEQLRDRMAAHVDLRRSRAEEWVTGLLGGWRRDDPWRSLEELLAQRAGRCIVLFDEVAIYLDQVARHDRTRAAGDLRELNRLRQLPDARFVLAGSIALRPVAEQLGERLSPDWVGMSVQPLDRASGATLFGHHCAGVCDGEPAALGHALAGGLPRWIKNLATKVRIPEEREATIQDVERAADALLATDPFIEELDHLTRHTELARRLRSALGHAAAPGATRLSVLAALQAEGCGRGQAEEAMQILVREHYLSPDLVFGLPLLGRWLRARA